MNNASPTAEPNTLLRKLGVTGVVGIAVAMVGPTSTMAFGVSPVVKFTGLAAPLTFLIGFVAMAVVGLSFAAFARRVASAGSARDYVRLAYGPRPGFLAGWALLLTYVTATGGAMAVTGNFAAEVLKDFGVRTSHLWPWLGSGLGLLAAWLCLRDVRVTGRVMLILEMTSILGLLVLAVVILIHLPLSAAPFKPEPGHGWSGIGYGLVFTVLAFAGFEGASTLGEEARNPMRAIPVALLSTLAVAGSFYVLVTYAQVVGFGPAGMDDLVRDPSPLATLASRFLSPQFAIIINLFSLISVFSITTASIAAASRILFSLSRSGLVPALAIIGQTYKVPTRAILAVTAAALLGLIMVRNSQTPVTYFSNLATISTLSLILVYLSVTSAELVIAWREHRMPGIVIGLVGLFLLLWPVFNSVYPVPAWPQDLWPYVVIAWLGSGIVLTMIMPSLTDVPEQAFDPALNLQLSARQISKQLPADQNR